MKNQEVKTNIEIGGAILTAEAIEQLAEWQGRDNDGIDCTVAALTSVICYLATEITSMSKPDEILKASRCIGDIAFVKENISKFYKP